MGTLKVEKYYANTGLALGEGLEVGLSFSSASKGFEGGVLGVLICPADPDSPSWGLSQGHAGGRGEKDYKY